MIDISWLPMLSPPLDTALFMGLLLETWRIEKKIAYIEGRLKLPQ